MDFKLQKKENSYFYSWELLTVNPESLNRDSFLASSLSCWIISSISSSRDIFGSQPNSFLALWDSPNKKSTSVGLKYLGSTLITISFVSALLPTSLSP